MVKRFQSVQRAPQQADSTQDLAPLPFTLPGNERVLVATAPKRAIWQRAVLASRANVPRDRQAAAIIDFARGVLANPADGQHLEDRLMNPSDPLDVVDLFEPVTWLSSSWGEQSKDPKVREEAWADYHAYLEEKEAAAQALRGALAGTVVEGDGEFAVAAPAAETPLAGDDGDDVAVTAAAL